MTKQAKMMAHDNHAISNSSISLSMPHEPRGSYRGSNEFILTSDDGEPCCNCSSMGAWLRTKIGSACSKKNLYKRLPICKWLPKYSLEDATGDLIAGITVGLTVIPQALAYAGIAGLDPAFGLYSSFLGSIIYVLLGSCKDVPMGPTAIASLLTYQAVGGVWQKAVLLCFLTGLIEIAMGVLGLGFLLNFISGPVSSGYTSAVSLIILSTQVKDIFGIKAKGTTFVEIWTSIFEHIDATRLNDTVMGISCIFVLLLMRLLVTVQIGPKDDQFKSNFHRIINKTLWLIGTARNAILVIVTGLISYVLHQSSYGELQVIGKIPSGMPSFQMPHFSTDDIRNQTTGEIIQKGQSFHEIVNEMGSLLIVIPLIALLENISVCKSFANGKSVDATQELLAIGTANVVNSFVQGYPGTGSLSRGAVNNASGVRTPMGGLFTGLLVIASLFLTPLFYYIPKAALASIIIAAVVFMVEVRVVKPMWRSKKTDLIPGMAAFIACLVLPLELGILAGIAINVIFILYHAARPKISIEFLSTSAGTKYLMLTPDRCLIFPSVDYVKNLVNKLGAKSQVPVVIDCTHIYGADFTAATVIETLVADFSARQQMLIFYNLKPSVGQVFEGVDTELNIQYDLTSLEKTINDRKT